MKRNTKFALMLVGASVIGSATTILATSAIEKCSNDSIADTFISANDNSGSFVRTASRQPALETDFTHAAEVAINSLVSIKSFATPKQQQYQGQGIDPFEFFFGPGFGFGDGNSQRRQQPQQQQQDSQEQMQPMGMGSGVVITADGYIVTNNHVISGADKLEVTLNDNTKYNAKIIGTDPALDLALLKVEAKNLAPLTFGDSDALKVGEWVLAVGNPFGLNSTVTAGIVSAKARGVDTSDNYSRERSIESYIQTDVAVNPGNSGGALVNTNGELVGINSMIYSKTGNYAGVSFAIPSSIVKKAVTDLKQYGAVQRAVLGIEFTELDSDKAKEKGITATNEGLLVMKVVDNGSAKEAGIKEGDVIVKINGEKVVNSGQTKEAMSKLRPGDKATIGFYRDNKLQTVTVTMKTSQGTTKVTKTADITLLGAAFKALSAEKKKELNLSSGLQVTGLTNGKFKDSGMKQGFIITDINNMAVSSTDDVERIYSAIMQSSDDKVMFITGIYPTGKKMYYAVDLAE